MTEETPAVPSAPPKSDPETLVLRANPGRVVRFRRGAIITIAALGSTAVVGVAWVALKPATFRVVAGNEDRPEANAATPPDVLADAPKSYGDVPVLGPPLPGDFGRPILEHQRSIGATDTVDPAVNAAARAAQEAEAERQRIAAERKAARESGVMMRMSGTSRPAAAPTENAHAIPTTSTPDAGKPRLALDPERDPNGQQRKADFVIGGDTAGDTNPLR